MCFKLSLLISLTGEVRILFLTCDIFSLASGGLAHNLGQLFTAWIITATPGVLAYLPFLVLSGIITGIFTGFCAHFLDRYLPS